MLEYVGSHYVFSVYSPFYSTKLRTDDTVVEFGLRLFCRGRVVQRKGGAIGSKAQEWKSL